MFALAVIAPALGIAALLTLTLKSRHDVLLVVVVALFATATFHDRVPGVTYPALTPLRFAAVAALIAVTLVESRRWHRPLSGAPAAARHLVRLSYGMALIGLISIAWSVDANRTAVQVVAYVALVGLLHVSMNRRWLVDGTAQRDLAVIAGTMGVVLALGLISPYLGIPNRDAYSSRYYGLMNNPNTVAMVAVLALALALGMLDRHLKMAVGVMSVAVFTLILAESRTGILAAALVGAWHLLRRRSGLALSTLAIVGVVVAVSLIQLDPPSILTPAIERFRSDTPVTTLGDRTTAWMTTIELWKLQPIAGYGFRTGESILGSESNLNYSVSHSSYLQILLEVGLIGALIGVALIVVLMRVAVRTRESGASAAIVSGLAIGLTESALWGTGQVYCWAFWLTAAAAAAVTSEPTSRISQPGTARLSDRGGRESATSVANWHYRAPRERDAQPAG